jgi:hypothetical protein
VKATQGIILVPMAFLLLAVTMLSARGRQ